MGQFQLWRDFKEKILWERKSKATLFQTFKNNRLLLVAERTGDNALALDITLRHKIIFSPGQPFSIFQIKFKDGSLVKAKSFGAGMRNK